MKSHQTLQKPHTIQNQERALLLGVVSVQYFKDGFAVPKQVLVSAKRCYNQVVHGEIFEDEFPYSGSSIPQTENRNISAGFWVLASRIKIEEEIRTIGVVLPSPELSPSC